MTELTPIPVSAPMVPHFSVVPVTMRGGSLPTGGQTDWALLKNSAQNGDASWRALNKALVGLGNVDNTSDANKPISTATQAAINQVQTLIASVSGNLGTLQGRVNQVESKANSAVQPGDLATVAMTGSYNDLKDKPGAGVVQVNSDWNAVSGVAQILNKPTLGTAAGQPISAFATSAQGAKADTAVQPSGLTKAAVGLSNVDNTSDANKPVSTAQQAAINSAVTNSAATITNSLAPVATTGTYNSLTGKPTLGTAAAQDATAFATSTQGTKADSAVQPATLATYVQKATSLATSGAQAGWWMNLNLINYSTNGTDTEPFMVQGYRTAAQRAFWFNENGSPRAASVNDEAALKLFGPNANDSYVGPLFQIFKRYGSQTHNFTVHSDGRLRIGSGQTPASAGVVVLNPGDQVPAGVPAGTVVARTPITATANIRAHSSSSGTTASATMTVNFPGTPVVGDPIGIWITTDNNTKTLASTPTGWTAEYNNAVGTAAKIFLHKVYAASDGSSVNLNFATAVNYAMAVAVLNGQAHADFGAVGSVSSRGASAATITCSATGSTSTPNLVVAHEKAATHTDGYPTSSPSVATVESVYNPAASGGAVFIGSVDTSGGTNTVTLTYATASANGAGYQIPLTAGPMAPQPGTLAVWDGTREINISTGGGGSSANLAPVATSGNYNDLTNKPNLGTAASQNTTAFATSAQGSKADTAVQPGANVSTLNNDAQYQKASDVSAAIAASQAGDQEYGGNLSVDGLLGAGGGLTSTGPTTINAPLTLGGSVTATPASSTAAGSGNVAVSAKTLWYCNATTGAQTRILPATTTPGLSFTFVKTDSTSNPVTISATSINGAATYVLSQQNDYVRVTSTTTSGTWIVTKSGRGNGVMPGGRLASAYGAVADARTSDDAAMTAGSASLTITNGTFLPTDVGKTIWVSGAGATVSTTTSAALSTSTVYQAIPVAALPSAIPAGKLTVTDGTNTDYFQCAATASGSTSIMVQPMAPTHTYASGVTVTTPGVLQTTVSAVTDAKHATLAASASNTTSTGTWVCGTDNTTALQAWLNDSTTLGSPCVLDATLNGRGFLTGTLTVPPGATIVGAGQGNPYAWNNIACSKIMLKPGSAALLDGPKYTQSVSVSRVYLDGMRPLQVGIQSPLVYLRDTFPDSNETLFTVRDVTIMRSSGDGIYLGQGNRGALIEGVYIAQCSGNGIQMRSSDSRIIGALIGDNYGDGIQMRTGGWTNTVTTCEMWNNANNISMNACHQVTITGNFSDATLLYGLNVSGSYGLNVSGNTFAPASAGLDNAAQTVSFSSCAPAPPLLSGNVFHATPGQTYAHKPGYAIYSDGPWNDGGGNVMQPGHANWARDTGNGVTGLAAVASSGSYKDLSNRPNLPPTYAQSLTSVAAAAMSWDPREGFYNATPTTLAKGLANIAKATTPDYTGAYRPLHEVWIGNSVLGGCTGLAGRDSGLTPVLASDRFDRLNTIADWHARTLARMMNGTVGGTGMIRLKDLGRNDARVTYSGFTPGSSSMPEINASNASITVTLNRGGTVARLAYYDNFNVSGGALRFAKNGVTSGTEGVDLSTIQGANSGTWKMATLNSTFVTGDQLTITNIRASGSVWVAWVSVEDTPAAGQVISHNLALSGSDITTWTGALPAATSGFTQDRVFTDTAISSVFTPGIIHITYPFFEVINNGYSVATFKTDMQKLIDRLTLKCPQAQIVLHVPPQKGPYDASYPPANQLPYFGALYELATTNNLPLFDFNVKSNGVSGLINLSMSGDAYTHLLPSAYSLWGSSTSHLWGQPSQNLSATPPVVSVNAYADVAKPLPAGTIVATKP